LIGLISGCQLFIPDIEIREKAVPVICDTTRRPDALDLKETPPTLVMNDAGTWGYWFDAEHYAALAENIQAMRRWMKQSKAINQKLVQCIENHNAQDGAQDATLGP
jgi:hypothetical protein